MANKHQVLALLAKGRTPSQIAEQLGCSSGYVRATKQRAAQDGMKRNREYQAVYRQKQREHRA